MYFCYFLSKVLFSDQLGNIKVYEYDTTITPLSRFVYPHVFGLEDSLAWNITKSLIEENVHKKSLEWLVSNFDHWGLSVRPG